MNRIHSRTLKYISSNRGVFLADVDESALSTEALIWTIKGNLGIVYWIDFGVLFADIAHAIYSEKVYQHEDD